jgi:hypothetical protein
MLAMFNSLVCENQMGKREFIEQLAAWITSRTLAPGNRYSRLSADRSISSISEQEDLTERPSLTTVVRYLDEPIISLGRERARIAEVVYFAVAKEMHAQKTRKK